MFLPDIDQLTIWYKYVATMTFVKRTYKHFKQSIKEKVKAFTTGRAQIHVVPFYFHETGIYYQPIFDFDKCNDKLEVLSFINSVLKTNNIRESSIFVELSPNGIHVGLKHAYGPLSIDDVKTIRSYCRKHFEQKFPHIDVISSVRFMAISRTPSFLKQKRMFAMEVSFFKKHPLKKLRQDQQKMKQISVALFENQINSYLFLHSIKPLSKAPEYVLKALNGD